MARQRSTASFACKRICNPVPQTSAARRNGGWGGIRTHEELAPLAVFKTAAFNRSATHPTAEFRHPAENRPGPKPRVGTELAPEAYHALPSPASAALMASAAFASLFWNRCA